MMMPPENKLSFPRPWEYRLFCQSGMIDAVAQEVRRIALEEGLTVTVTDGAASKNGTYRTLHVGCTVENLERANLFGERFGKLPGVRFLL